MKSLIRVLILVLTLLMSSIVVSATQQQILVEMNEYVNQETLVNPLKTSSGLWADANEQISNFNYTGNLIVSNTNPNGKTISNIYISLTNTGNITLPLLVAGRNATWISNDTTSQTIVLHIPELNSGENSSFIYYINKSIISPPINFTTKFSHAKILAGENITLVDTIQNNFDNFTFQPNTCINNINITQKTIPYNFSGDILNWHFSNSSTTGLDSSNVTYSTDNQTLYWNSLGGSCLNKSQFTNISYVVSSPFGIPKSQHYKFMNTSIHYKLNNTISHLRMVDIYANSEAKLSIQKKIIAPSDSFLYGSNVTWRVNGYFNTNSNITYNLTSVTLWVSQRNVNGSYTDPNTIDNDTISNATLFLPLSPFSFVNSTSPWVSSDWLFNYSDIPSPIVWGEANFTIANDGTQLVNRSITQDGTQIYIKELYLIQGYWLEINKNITSLDNDSYNIKIDVKNKGNQVTPSGTVVTIYDFVPTNFNVTSNFTFSSSPWYDTTTSNNSVLGNYSGMLYQWGLIANNSKNTSFDAGPTKNINNSWSVEYNVSGLGDYSLVDVFITGLDPQQVDGAGSTKAVVVSEVIDKMKSTEGVFAVIASILLLFGLIL